MSEVRVNLLPREYEERAAARRATAFTILALVLFVIVLAVVYFLKVADVNAARDERDAAQAEVARLQAEVAQLAEFQELADRLESRNALLATAMATEISWARVLNDLSLSFPSSSSLVTLTANATTVETAPPAATGEQAVDFGEQVGAVTFTGYSVERYAPGVEAVLLEFADVRAFFNPFLNVAAEEERGTTEVTTFDGSVLLNEEAYTQRYASGLPGGFEL